MFSPSGLAGGALAALLLVAPSIAQTDSLGITEPVKLPPFDAAAAACSPPPGLERTLAYVQENEREFLAGVDYGLAKAAADRGLRYEKALAESNIDKAIEEVEGFRAAKVGAIIATSSDPTAIAPHLQASINSGEFIGTIVPPPATLILNAPQYQTGKVLTDEAIRYIKTEHHGYAHVVLLTQDSMQYLTPRFTAMRDGLARIPGVTIIADIAPSPVTRRGGFETMKTILLANPAGDIDVVLGADSVVLGALDALRDAGLDRPDQFLGGIDGEPAAVAEIERGDGPYKASIALSSPVFGYAMGRYGADWLEGKSVPQAMDILPIALTKENLPQYRADLADPGAVFKDPARRNLYLSMYGNICYDTRDQYLNFPWSSEAVD